MSNGKRLNGRVAVITGAAQGIGFGIAERLASEGALTILADVKIGVATAPRKDLSSRGIRPRRLPSISVTMPPLQNWRRRSIASTGAAKSSSTMPRSGPIPISRP